MLTTVKGRVKAWKALAFKSGRLTSDQSYIDAGLAFVYILEHFIIFLGILFKIFAVNCFLYVLYRTLRLVFDSLQLETEKMAADHLETGVQFSDAAARLNDFMERQKNERKPV